MAFGSRNSHLAAGLWRRLGQTFCHPPPELNPGHVLRISDELYLKRLIVGGLEKVYEVSRIFVMKVSPFSQSRIYSSRILLGLC